MIRATALGSEFTLLNDGAIKTDNPRIRLVYNAVTKDDPLQPHEGFPDQAIYARMENYLVMKKVKEVPQTPISRVEY